MLSFRTRALGAAVLIAAAAACVMAAPAGADATKPFSVDISPGTIKEGVTVQFQAKITNQTASQTLGSANLTVPEGFSVVGPHGIDPMTGRDVVELRNLAIAPMTSAIAAFTVTVPACRTAGFTWGVAAKQSNDFNGSGNDFGPLDPASKITTSLACAGVAEALPCAGSCSDTGSDPVTGASIDVTVDPPNNGLLTINVGAGLDCAGYTENLPDTDFSVDFLPDPGTIGGLKTVVLHIPKAAMQAIPNNGVSKVNVCFGVPAPATFVVKPDTPPLQLTPDGFNIGLLPDCGTPAARPCVSARTGEGGGAAITVLALGGADDPRYNG